MYVFIMYQSCKGPSKPQSPIQDTMQQEEASEEAAPGWRSSATPEDLGPSRGIHGFPKLRQLPGLVLGGCGEGRVPLAGSKKVSSGDFFCFLETDSSS